MNNTIFDDVFRTMIEKMPYLAVPLINEVFHASYPEDVKITQLRNEHQQEEDYHENWFYRLWKYGDSHVKGNFEKW